MIIAHRGYHKDVKENTIAAFDAAIAAGADGIECDLRLTRDNQVVVNHWNWCKLGEKRLLISRTQLSDLIKLRSEGDERLLTMDELFGYIQTHDIQFFLEMKNIGRQLVEQVVRRIDKHDLWHRVILTSVFLYIRTILSAQQNNPELKVMQSLSFPLLSYLKHPISCHGIFLSWLDYIPGNPTIVRNIFPSGYLRALRQFYEERGFTVASGLINSTYGMQRFRNAGFTNMVTDNVPEAVAMYSQE